MPYTIWGFDIGKHTKALRFHGDDRGRLWFPDGFPEDIPRVETPHGGPAAAFMPRLHETLRAHALWDETALAGYSVCGPVVGDRCLLLINRDIQEPFTVGGDVAVNDGMAATIGALVAGVARRHPGGLACFTLGTGIGFGAFHWNERGERVANDGEVHFTIRSGTERCNCHRRGCFEAAANEAALRRYLHAEGFNFPESGDLGREMEQYVRAAPPPPERETVERALDRWHRVLAEGVANVYALLNLGGNNFQPPALFVFGGGLSTIVAPENITTYVLEEFHGDPFLGRNFRVRCETVLGNRAGCVGAAALALANRLGRPVTAITFLDTPPADF